MQRTVLTICVAGDLIGIEEASTAMEEGRLADLAAAATLRYLSPEERERKKAEIRERLGMMRMGSFGEARASAKDQIIKARLQR